MYTAQKCLLISIISAVHRVLETLLMNDEDLVSLYLTHPDRDIKDHQEVELLVEAYSHDLFDIICEIRNMKVWFTFY